MEPTQDGPTTPRKKRHVYTIAERVALVRKTRGLMRREQLTIAQAAERLGYHWTNYYAWAKEGKRKAHRRSKRAVPAGVRKRGDFPLLAALLTLPERLGVLETEWAAFKRALGVKPEDLR